MKFEPIKLGTFLLLLGAFVFYLKYTDVPIKNSNDLYFTKGHLSSHRFVRGYRGSLDYSIKLEEFTNSFQIKADFVGVFQTEAFEKLKEGEELTFAIYKKKAECLNNTTDNIGIYSLESSKIVFLATDSALKIHNSNGIYYLVACITFTGLVLVIYGYSKRRKKRWTGRIKPLKRV